MFAEIVFALNLVLFLINVYKELPILISFFKQNKKKEKRETKQNFPFISIIVPAYREGKNLEKTLKYLSRINYPQEKLEFIIATELDDKETGEIARKIASTRKNFKHLIVKETPEPRGKPRALNQALEVSRGEIIGVVDSEDIVDPELCNRVVEKIHEGYDAVQGILDMQNDFDGWLNLHFRAEYGHWYNVYMNSLEDSGFPLPLGGTTNFIKRDVLEKLGGWDSFNLTEDFELGLRLYANSMRVGMVQTVTREESPTTFRAWLKQRTRWQRGKIQTLRKLYKIRTGIRKKLNILLVCLVPHVPVLNIILLAFSLVFLFAGVNFPAQYSYLIYSNLAVIFALELLHANGYMIATRAEHVFNRRTRAILCGITLPAYWAVFWAADLRAIKQEIIDRKVFWEKTEHKSRHASPEAVIRKIAIKPVLKHAGFKLRGKARIKGKSGVSHTFDVVASRGREIIVIQGIESEGKVGKEGIIGIALASKDVNASSTLIVASPELDKEARNFAKYYNIQVIETEKLDYNVSIPFPDVGSS